MEGNKEKWVNETLDSLEGLQRAKSPEGMYQRVMDHIQSDRFRIVADTVPVSTVYRAAAAIALIVALNTFSCVMFSKNRIEQKQLQAFATEYSLGSVNNGLLNIQ